MKGRLDLAVNDLGPTPTQEYRRADPGLFARSRHACRSRSPHRPQRPKNPRPPRLSIVVLPFANIGGDPEQELFRRRRHREPDHGPLAHPGAFVIGRNTAFTYKGKAVDLKQIGRELNVRYVLEGSVQRGGNRMRVNVQLIEAETGAHLWAERFDKPVADLFEMQDEIVSRLANRLGQELIVRRGAARREVGPSQIRWITISSGSPSARKGITAEISAKHVPTSTAHSISIRTMSMRLVGRADVDLVFAANYLSDDRAERPRSAEADLGKALKLRSEPCQRPLRIGGLAHLWQSRRPGHRRVRARFGDRPEISPPPTGGLVWRSSLPAATKKPRRMFVEALRISPHDSRRIKLDEQRRSRQTGRRPRRGRGRVARPVGRAGSQLASAPFLAGCRPRAYSGVLKKRAKPRGQGWNLTPLSPSRGSDPRRSATIPIYLAGRERVYEGMRKAGVPEE